MNKWNMDSVNFYEPSLYLITYWTSETQIFLIFMSPIFILLLFKQVKHEFRQLLWAFSLCYYLLNKWNTLNSKWVIPEQASLRWVQVIYARFTRQRFGTSGFYHSRLFVRYADLLYILRSVMNKWNTNFVNFFESYHYCFVVIQVIIKSFILRSALIIYFTQGKILFTIILYF